jgi:protein disulfide-isomerase A1
MANEIAAWVNKKIGPAATPLAKAEEVAEFIENNEVAVVGFFKDLESKQAKDYLAAVKDYEEYPCGITSNEDAMKAHDVSNAR